MFEKIKHRTDFLFSRTGFLTGAGSVFNLAGNYYEFNSAESAEEADRRALAADWAVVGQDVSFAITTLGDSIARQRKNQLTFEFDERETS
jgi:hypothetical protein